MKLIRLATVLAVAMLTIVYQAEAQTTVPPSQITAATSVKIFGASGSASNTTGSISASSTSLTLASAIDFANGQGIRINNVGPAPTVGAPTSPAVTPNGTAGSTTYTYQIYALDANGGIGTPLTATTSTGNATLGITNFNRLTWTAATGSPAGYGVCKSISGTQTPIGIATGASFNDYGYTSYTAADWFKCGASNDWIVTKISSGAGSTTLVLSASATNAGSSVNVFHDDTAAIAATLAASTSPSFPSGTFYVSGGFSPKQNATISGQSFATLIQDVSLGGTVFNLNLSDHLTGVMFNLLPNQTAVNALNINSLELEHLQCYGAGSGLGGTPSCLVINDSSSIFASDIWLLPWSGIITGQGTGGTPPIINVTGTAPAGPNAVNLTFVMGLNNASQVMAEDMVIFNDAFNSSMTSSYLNGISTTLTAGSSGLEVEGPGQVDNFSNNQFLNFNADVRMDSTGAGSPLTVNFTHNHFDFCSAFCLLNAAATWVNEEDNTFAGESGLSSAIAIDWAGTATSGPNVISGNTIDGFVSPGFPINFSVAPTNTYVFGNPGANNNATFVNGSVGSGSVIGQTCSGTPSSSFSSVQGIVGHC